MQFRIEHESRNRMRVHLYIPGRKMEEGQEEVLHYALSAIQGVRRVEVYLETGNVALSYEGKREDILNKLRELNYENVRMFAQQIDQEIDEEEIRSRKLSPTLKRRMRRKIVIEAAADLFLPAPVQLAYHVYQLITLRDL